jgi:LuxR family maltose regulon positive regulatory protein
VVRLEALPPLLASYAARIQPILTPRQIDVLELIAEDMNGDQIAAALGISVRTVHVYRLGIHKVLGTNTSAGAVVQALKLGLIRL